MHKWYVVQVLSGQEKRVKKTLEEQLEHKGVVGLIEKIIIPSENVSEIKRGQQKIVEKKLWPGYLLLKMTLTDESWSYVTQSVGVIDFLGGKVPAALTEEEVEEVLRDLQEKKDRVTQKHKFEIGDRVKIVDGVFVNFKGTLLEVFHDKGTLSVLVSIFGRETRVDDLEFAQVEKLSPEEEVGE